MVAVIRTALSIRQAFMYNENKLDQGVARCISVVNYPVDLQSSSRYQRLNMLERTAEMNPDIQRKSIHISLNFAPEEKLSDDQMDIIAREYMAGIGFGLQPYLVYRHEDAGHPHLHIVSTKVRRDGTSIPTQNIGRNQSEQARKMLEKKYGLVRAEDQHGKLFQLKPVDASKVQYGKIPTKKAISSVLSSVLTTYKYTSIGELNAVLNLYNVGLDRGMEQSRTYRNGGLFYQVLQEGRPVGVPIKASLFPDNPGLKFLERQFLKNDVQRQLHRDRLRNTIDMSLLRNGNLELGGLITLLKKEGIDVVIRRNSNALVYGLTFVDHRTRSVFNGSKLGKKYSAKGILDQLATGTKGLSMDGSNPVKSTVALEKTVPILSVGFQSSEQDMEQFDYKFLEELMGYEYLQQRVPFEWRKRKKKKRK